MSWSREYANEFNFKMKSPFNFHVEINNHRESAVRESSLIKRVQYQLSLMKAEGYDYSTPEKWDKYFYGHNLQQLGRRSCIIFKKFGSWEEFLEIADKGT